MKVFKQSIFYLIIIISVLIILVSLLSLIRDLTYWYSKILDFPRLQYLILALVCLFLFLLLNSKWGFSSLSLVLGLLVAITIQSTRILPYVAGETTVPDAIPELVKQENAVGVLIANVLITNRHDEAFLGIVERQDPDMLLVMEVNEWWIKQLQPLEEEYPYVMEYPQDNAYGMALYSRLPLENPEIKFLKHQDVPSFHARVVLPSGNTFMFHGVHPVAPVPSSKYPDNVGEEEVAFLKIGETVAANPLPAIVAGDFNDVSWSHTARLFGESGNLNNVRVGRGLYNSFDAKSPILRWPLDHYFISDEWALLELERLPDFCSDHFPMFAKFVLEGQNEQAQNSCSCKIPGIRCGRYTGFLNVLYRGILVGGQGRSFKNCPCGECLWSPERGFGKRLGFPVQKIIRAVSFFYKERWLNKVSDIGIRYFSARQRAKIEYSRGYMRFLQCRFAPGGDPLK